MNSLLLTIRATDIGTYYLTANDGPGSSFNLPTDWLNELWDESAVRTNERGSYHALRKCLGLITEQRPTPDELKSTGAWLFDRIFGGQGDRPYLAYVAAVGVAIDHDEPFRLLVKVDTADLAGAAAASSLERLPWEMLVDPVTGQFWGLSDHIVLSRVVWFPTKNAPVNIGPDTPLKFCHIAAAPVSYGATHDYTHESTMVTSETARSPWIVQSSSNLAANISSLQQALTLEPHGLLITAHGDLPRGAPIPTVVFHSGESAGNPVDIAEFIFNQIRLANLQPPRIIALNACRSVNIAHRLSDQGIPAVGMTGVVWYNDFGMYVHACILSELFWDGRLDFAIREVRKRLSAGCDLPGQSLKEGINQREIFAWQAMFIACVLPYVEEHKILDHAPLARLTMTGAAELDMQVTWQPVMCDDALPACRIPLGPGLSTIVALPAQPVRLTLTSAISEPIRDSVLCLNLESGDQLSLTFGPNGFTNATGREGLLTVKGTTGWPIRQGYHVQRMPHGPIKSLNVHDNSGSAWLPPGRYIVLDDLNRLNGSGYHTELSMR